MGSKLTYAFCVALAERRFLILLADSTGNNLIGPCALRVSTRYEMKKGGQKGESTAIFLRFT